MFALESSLLRLEVNPEVGASVAAFEARLRGEWVPVIRPTPRPLPQRSSPYSSFTLAPYSNRIRGARFRFAGREYRLEPNTPEGNAQHGDVRNRSWQVEKPDPGTLVCSFESGWFEDVNWPWAFTLLKTYRLEGNTFDTVLELTNASDEPMPAGFGLHPYFVWRLPGSRDVELQFSAKGYYRTDASLIPDGPMGAVPAELDFSRPRALGEQKVNGVYGGWDGRARLEWPGSGVRMRLEADPVFAHLVVFTAPDGTLAVEPVTNATDGFNLMAQGVEGHGVMVLGPGERLRGRVRLRLEGP
ncbi:MAG: aldose 1-epimerase [Meiothermus sp.]